MANLTDLVVPIEAYQQNAFDKRSEEIQTTRLNNRKALMEIYNESAKNGVSLSMEEMAQQAQSILGPTSWLYSTAPSVDVINVMRKNQNEAAGQATEKLRRDQFTTDINESKNMESFISDSAMTGKSADEIHAAGVEQFGDRFTKVAPNVTRIMDKASFQAMNDGATTVKNFGMLTDDAEDYIDQNKSHLSEPMITGIRRAAQTNQSAAEDKIMTAARGLAGQGGWANTADDAQNIRNVITSAYPTMKPETVESIYKKAMDAAKVAAGTKSQADDNTTMLDARKQAVSQAGQMQITLIGQEQKELEQRDVRATAFRQQAQQVVANQEKFRQDINGNKKTGEKPIFDDHNDVSQAQRILDTYKVDNLDGLVEVIKSHNQKRIKQYIAELQPMSVYVDRVNQSAMLTTTPMTSYTEFLGRASSMGATDAAIMDMGKKYKDDIDTLLKSPPIDSAAQTSSWSLDAPLKRDGMIRQGGIDENGNIISGPGRANSSTEDDGNPMSMATTKAAETRINGMMSTASSQIKAFREMAVINQSFSATPEQMVEQERAIALKMAKTFLGGAGYTPDSKAYGESAEAMADQILRGAGDPMHITRRTTAADRLREYNNSVASGQGVRPASMVPPGSVMPNQRAGLTGSAGLQANFQ